MIVGALVSTLLMLHSWLVSPPSADRELTGSRKVADKKLKKNKIVRGLTAVAFILSWRYLKYLITRFKEEQDVLSVSEDSSLLSCWPYPRAQARRSSTAVSDCAGVLVSSSS